MNKDLVKYVSIIGFIIALSSSFFLKDFGAFIPTMMEYFTGVKDISKDDLYIVNLGYFGSFLAGTLGLIFGFVSLIFLIFTFLEQSRKNEISEIENRIFKLIELLIEIKNQNQLSEKSQNFLDDNNNISNLNTLKKNLKKEHLQFSNFFRMLYQILKYINEHESIINNKYFSKKLDNRVKSYTNIIRSYLDTNLLTCLAINCYCLEEENGEYNNYKKLLERYELLEHLPNASLMQFSSYLYYDEKAFGNSTWFKNFQIISKHLKEISTNLKTYDFRSIFLVFLSKNNGIWKNNNVVMSVKTDLNKKSIFLSIVGIQNPEIQEKIEFTFNSFQNISISSIPFDLNSNDFKARIFKDTDKLNLTFLIPLDDHRRGYECYLSLNILSENQLEIEFIDTYDFFDILPF